MTDGFDAQIEHLRSRWPQAHCEPLAPGLSDDGRELIILPGVILPKGWTHTICTVLFKIRVWRDRPSEGLNGFFVDLPDLRIAGSNAAPHYSATDAPTRGEIEDYLGRRCRGYEDAAEFDAASKKVFADPKRHWISGHPQWRGLTRFWWRTQYYNPNCYTLFTAAMQIRQRLQIAR